MVSIQILHQFNVFKIPDAPLQLENLSDFVRIVIMFKVTNLIYLTILSLLFTLILTLLLYIIQHRVMKLKQHVKSLYKSNRALNVVNW
jgi:hypothetical protein